MGGSAVIFPLANVVAMLCWLALAASLFVPTFHRWTFVATALVVPATLAVAYILLIAHSMAESAGGGFGSIGAVRTLFANDAALTAGWLHYLAFDLFVGTWIARAGLAANMRPLAILPCLALTFLFGPAGLLLFLALRFAFGRHAAPTEILP